jgi:hypothetical protein
LDEVSALAPKDVILEMYKMATDDPFSFLFVKLSAKDKNNMFYINYQKRLELN